MYISREKIADNEVKALQISTLCWIEQRRLGYSAFDQIMDIGRVNEKLEYNAFLFAL